MYNVHTILYVVGSCMMVLYDVYSKDAWTNESQNESPDMDYRTRSCSYLCSCVRPPNDEQVQM